ncbi:MAG: transposase domain-containing protein [Sedimentisphaerales bacterium]|nr:transposase domain-containing protein [Sedimentisphaerales bacterium]
MGDLLMSLIHTCELNKVNPFDYMAQLQKHASEPSSDPNSWAPWSYRDMLQRTDAP